MAELVLTLATILQKAELHLESDQPIEHSLSVTLRPKKPMYARVARLSSRAATSVRRPALAVRARHGGRRAGYAAPIPRFGRRPSKRRRTRVPGCASGSKRTDVTLDAE